jgi:hypothetical protein
MTIDKATRGEGGMTAEIELSAKTSKPCRTRPGYLGEPFTKLFAAVATPAAVAAPVQVTQPDCKRHIGSQRPAATQHQPSLQRLL